VRLEDAGKIKDVCVGTFHLPRSELRAVKNTCIQFERSTCLWLAADKGRQEKSGLKSGPDP
jgi:hypothetical protein